MFSTIFRNYPNTICIGIKISTCCNWNGNWSSYNKIILETWIVFRIRSCLRIRITSTCINLVRAHYVWQSVSRWKLSRTVSLYWCTSTPTISLSTACALYIVGSTILSVTKCNTIRTTDWITSPQISRSILLEESF